MLICIWGLACAPVWAEGFRQCGRPAPDAPAVQTHADGSVSVFGQAPGAARLKMTRADMDAPAFCGGTLVAPQWVLTARHCVDTKVWQELRIDLGAAVLGRRGQGAVRFGQVALCPTGSLPGKLALDYALVRLDRPVPADLRPTTIAQRPITAGGEGPSTMTLAHWRARDLQRLMSPLSLTQIEISAQNPDGLLVGKRTRKGDPAPCGGESGSGLLAGGDDAPLLVALLSALLPSPADGDRLEICKRPGTLALFTPVGGLGAWVEDVTSECRAEPRKCAISE